MKHIKPTEIRKCVIKPIDDFERDVKSVFDNVEVIYDFDGIDFSGASTEDVIKEMSKFYDINITSIHADDCEYVGVWICFKEN